MKYRFDRETGELVEQRERAPTLLEPFACDDVGSKLVETMEFHRKLVNEAFGYAGQ